MEPSSSMEFGIDMLENIPSASETEPRPVHQKECDHFKIEKLPLGLQLRIIDKFDFRTHSIARQCSSKMKETCESQRKRRYPLQVLSLFIGPKRMKVEDFSITKQDYVRTAWQSVEKSKAKICTERMEINCVLTTERCRKLLNIFRRNGTTAVFVVIFGRIDCGPAQLEALLKQLQVSQLQTTGEAFLSNEMLLAPNILELDGLWVENTIAGDKELRKMKTSNFALSTDNVTPKGIANFLKQWQAGARSIEFFGIYFNTSAGTRAAEEIVDGLDDCQLVWSPATHRNTLIGAVPVDELYNPETAYCLTRKGADSIETLMVKIIDSQIEAVPELPEEHLINQLNKHQFYDLTGLCYACRTEFCVHFPRFSLPSFRRSYPRATEFINTFSAFAMVSIVVVDLFYLPTLLNPCHFRFRLRRSYLDMTYHEDE